MSAVVALWGAGTPRTLRPIWAAEEVGIDYDLEPIGPRTGETQTPEFTALTPKQKVPLLVQDDFRLSESLAITRHLLASYPAEDIYRPATPEERAREDEWCCHLYGELDETSLYVMRRHGDLGPIYGSAPDVVQSAREYAARQLVAVDRLLGHRQTVLEGGFGLADLFLQSCLDWAAAYEVEMPEGLETYRLRTARRDAYQRAMRANYGEKFGPEIGSRHELNTCGETS